jgi:hypothetical protein
MFQDFLKTNLKVFFVLLKCLLQFNKKSCVHDVSSGLIIILFSSIFSFNLKTANCSSINYFFHHG